MKGEKQLLGLFFKQVYQDDMIGIFRKVAKCTTADVSSLGIIEW
jgi:hypothetical protein